MSQSHNQMVARIAALEAELAGVKKFQPKEGDQCWSLGMVTLPSFAGSWIQLLDPAQKLAANLHWCRAGEERSMDLEAQAAFILAAINGNLKPQESPSFQNRVDPWLHQCFGGIVARDKKVRNHRFFEEATELVQAGGMTREEAYQLVHYVFDRPQGGIYQEVGGVMVTLAALCLAHGYDMHTCGDIELDRISTPEMTKKIAEKSANKPKFSPLPQKNKMNAQVFDECIRNLESQAKVEQHDDKRKYLYDMIERFKNETERVDDRPICSADGCSRRESCGSNCRDNGNFDAKPVKVVRREDKEEIIGAVFNNIKRGGSLAQLIEKTYGVRVVSK